MIPFDEMPADNAELVNIDIDLPRLQPDSADSCPVPLEDLVAYLRLESPDYESVQASQLLFLRTALVADHRYWIWSFQESDGTECFATVSAAPDGTACRGYDDNSYGLTPEQFMLGTFHQVF